MASTSLYPTCAAQYQMPLRACNASGGVSARAGATRQRRTGICNVLPGNGITGMGWHKQPDYISCFIMLAISIKAAIEAAFTDTIFIIA